MSKKPFELGITVGRFQSFHIGHELMIDTACALCERVVVLVGSSQESGTAKNPLTYDQRERILRRVFGDRIEIYPLPDIGVGNNGKWGGYVLQKVEEFCHRRPDLLVSGKEERRLDWFDTVEGLKIAELYIPKTIEISASEMRAHLICGDKAAWQEYTDPLLWDDYEWLKAAVERAKDNQYTDSL